MPRCGNHTNHGGDYAEFLKLAETSQIKLFCVHCGLPWVPSPFTRRTAHDRAEPTQSDRGLSGFGIRELVRRKALDSAAVLALVAASAAAGSKKPVVSSCRNAFHVR
jgi:hypothetical protein